MWLNKIQLSCLLIFLTGCVQPADISNPHMFNEPGLSFEYPGNWEVTFNEVNNDIRNIDIESGQSAVAYVIDFPRETVIDSAEFRQAYMEGFKDKIVDEGGQVSVSQSVAVEAKIDGKTRMGTKNRLLVRVGNIEEVYHQIFYLYSVEEGMMCLVFQVADHDLIETIKGFELILSTIHKGPVLDSI